MEIRLPKNTEDLRIKHLKALMNPSYNEDLTLMQVNEFMAEFTGEHINDILVIDAHDIIKMYHHVKEIYSEIKVNKPPQLITLGGIEYELINPHKVGSGWHMDWSKGDINKDPVWLACLFYYPKGVKYGTTDENKNLLYPIKDRYNIFERELSLQTFLEASAFFLTKIEQSTRLSMARQKTTERTVKLLTSLGGKKR
jgi:hypothetical protein